MATTTDDWTRTITTLPYPLPSSADRTPTLTSRLLIRPLIASDLDGFHILASNYEVMKWTAAGRAHTNPEETRKKLDQFLPPNDTKTFNCAICLRETGEFVGIGGVHQFSRVEEAGLHSKLNPPGLHNGYGWPELGYLIKQEYWGKGLATEFVMAFLGIWEELHRVSVEVEVNTKSLVNSGGDCGDGASAPAKEALIAMIDRTNVASQRILQKCGFERFDDFTKKDGKDPDKSVEVIAYRFFSNNQK